MNEVIYIFIYPDNLTAKATLWLWELKDLAIVGIGLLLSALALASWGFLLPLVLTVLYAFLSIRMEDASILDFLRNCQRQPENVIFRRNGMSFFGGQHAVGMQP